MIDSGEGSATRSISNHLPRCQFRADANPNPWQKQWDSGIALACQKTQKTKDGDKRGKRSYHLKIIAADIFKKRSYGTGEWVDRLIRYEGTRKMRKSGIIFSLLAVSIASCTGTKISQTTSGANEPVPGNSVRDRDTITSAIEKHLRENSGINMPVMDMSLSDVKVTGDQAQANAEFHLKQGGTSMLIIYKLKRHAGDWIVLSNQPSGGQFAHPPMDRTHSGSASNLATEPMPDVSDFLKNRPPTAGTSP